MKRVIALLLLGLATAPALAEEPSVVKKAGDGIKKGGEAAARGIEKGIDATEDGLKKGAAATGKGLEKAGQWIQKKVGQGDE